MTTATTKKSIDWMGCENQEDVDWLVYINGFATGNNPYPIDDLRHSWFQIAQNQEIGSLVCSEKWIAYCERS